jgi:hypothetical protein
MHGMGAGVHPHYRLPQDRVKAPLPEIVLALEPDLIPGDLAAQEIGQQGAAVQGLGSSLITVMGLLGA